MRNGAIGSTSPSIGELIEDGQTVVGQIWHCGVFLAPPCWECDVESLGEVSN